MPYVELAFRLKGSTVPVDHLRLVCRSKPDCSRNPRDKQCWRSTYSWNLYRKREAPIVRLAPFGHPLAGCIIVSALSASTTRGSRTSLKRETRLRPVHSVTISLVTAPMPTMLEAVPGDEPITLSWMVPESDGGSAFAKYQYRVSPDKGGAKTGCLIRDRKPRCRGNTKLVQHEPGEANAVFGEHAKKVVIFPPVPRRPVPFSRTDLAFYNW